MTQPVARDVVGAPNIRRYVHRGQQTGLRLQLRQQFDDVDIFGRLDQCGECTVARKDRAERADVSAQQREQVFGVKAGIAQVRL